MRHLILTLILLQAIADVAVGQQRQGNFPLENRTLYLTIKGGIQRGYSGPQINNIKPSIISDDFDENTYKTTEMKNVGGVVGLSFYYGFITWLSIEVDFLLANNKAGYKYNDIKDLQYELTLDYRYANIVLGPKIYPFGFGDRIGGEWPNGIFVRPGIYGSLNAFNPGQKNLTYSHVPESLYGPSGYIEEELRKLVKGQDNWGWMAAIGFEWMPIKSNRNRDSSFGLIFEASYFHGFEDVVKIKPQAYGFRSDISNYIRPLQFTVGLAIALSQKSS
ncbi:MAG: hypothetical protein JNN28_09655 [Saprospiraceae bacterium]|nr:hypothetical protein [Saprospiraceae bacterium]